MSRTKRMGSEVGTWICAALALGSAAMAQIPPPEVCPISVNEELRTLPELRAVNGVLSTTFTVESKRQCVPVLEGSGNNATYVGNWMDLRTYVYKDPSTGEERWGYPGPTLRIRKQEEVEPPGGGKPKLTPGDRLTIDLVNNLGPEAEHGKCDDACAGTGTNCSDIPLPTGLECAKAAGANPPKILPGCCCLVNQTNTWPECFHGNNTTNLHFHGSHVSPQPPQDYVLLELYPKEGCNPASAHPTHARGKVACGRYKYDVDPPPPTQAEGTHWYHPHKHGSVSLQVANGMPGALIIEGWFDDWLQKQYGGKLTEKILVLQQVKQQTNLYNDPVAPPLLINGQVNPVVRIRPGEVQRWRVVNATMEIASQVAVTFPPGARVRQIAMDGVRFSPENYATQPLCNHYDPCQVMLSPGNRADFLVEGPAAPGAYRLTYRLAVPGAVSRLKHEKLRLREQALLKLEAQSPHFAKAAGDSSQPALLTLVVDEPQPGAPKQDMATGFPTEWPKMPWYLQDLSPHPDSQQHMIFAMTSTPGDPRTQFTINDMRFNDQCVDVTTEVNQTDAWLVQNSSVLAHPFHIHINPFQLVEQGTLVNFRPVAFVKYASPIWQDTVALPIVDSKWDVDAGPIWNEDDAQQKCPGVCQKAHGGTWNGNWRTTVPNKMSVCNCSYTGNGYVLFRHRYLDFTGEYVLHCHFLGHEDRGMMLAVQTVCNDDPSKFGKATPYPKKECVPGNLIPAAPVCPLSAASASGQAGHSGHQ